MSVDPALILSILVGVFHASLFILIRGSARGRLPIILAAAILGAWAGDALGDRLGLAFLTIGDFHLLAASVVAWVGIGISSEEGRPAASFMRGLTLGAIIGAIIAGSSIWSRRRRGPASSPSETPTPTKPS